MSLSPTTDAPRRGAEDALHEHTGVLLELAEAAIDHGLAHGCAPAVDAAVHAPALQTQRSAFVTLFDARGELRGCMGSVTPYRPLAVEVSANAYAAAFRDPRFLPLAAAERAGLSCRLSVLTRPEPVSFASEAELVANLRPGVDGVMIEGDSCHGTFLPAVWEQIPERVDFWLALKRKAGVPLDECPPDLQVYRYRTLTLG